MDTRNIANTLDGLSSETRLDIFRLLVLQAGGDGLAVGVIAEQLGISASTLAFHLRSLVGAGLVLRSQLIFESKYQEQTTMLALDGNWNPLGT